MKIKARDPLRPLLHATAFTDAVDRAFDTLRDLLPLDDLMEALEALREALTR